MSGLYVNQASFIGKGRVFGKMRASEPAAFRIVAVLVLKRSFQNEDLFSAPVPVPVEFGAWFPSHQRDIFNGRLMQRQDSQPDRGSRKEVLLMRGNMLLILVGAVELMQFDKYRAALIGVRRMACADRVSHVGACWKIAGFVGKNAF